MRRASVLRGARCIVSAGLSVVLVVGATYVPQVNHATVALALVLLTVGLSMHWGWAEALTASFVGGLAFDYYFLPPAGLSIEAPEHWVTLAAFLLTAITTGQLSARAARNRAEAEARRDEMARLYRLGNALLDSDGADGAWERTAKQITEIFHARSAVFFDLESDRVLRSGLADDFISEEKLRRVAATGKALSGAAEESFIVPVWRGGSLAGSLGIAGASITPGAADAIAERVGVALARVHAAQESMAAELARRSENLKSAVLDALAHEIKGPLATVKVSVTTLLSQPPESAAQQRELLSIIDEESDRIGRWIDDAVEVSRSQADQLNPRKMPNALGRGCATRARGPGPARQGAANRLTRSGVSSGHRVRCRDDRKGNPADPGQRLEILAARLADRRIRGIHWRRDCSERRRSRVRRSGESNGSESSSRTIGAAAPAATRQGPGWVLRAPGASCRRMAARSGSRPRRAAVPRSIFRCLLRWMYPMSELKVLNVDDEPQARRAVKIALVARGLEVFEASSGEEALERLRSEGPDVVLLDVNMSGMNGIETCRAIRASSDVPVIVLSVRKAGKEKAEAFEAVRRPVHHQAIRRRGTCGPDSRRETQDRRAPLQRDCDGRRSHRPAKP